MNPTGNPIITERHDLGQFHFPLQLEMCLAVKVVQGEAGWHDLPCSEQHPVVCEESDYA